jgi:hypothetical protein
MVIWYILLSFGIFYVRLVFFSFFGMFYKEKSGNTAAREQSKPFSFSPNRSAR